MLLTDYYDSEHRLRSNPGYERLVCTIAIPKSNGSQRARMMVVENVCVIVGRTLSISLSHTSSKKAIDDGHERNFTIVDKYPNMR